ncbi:MAG: FAD-dependent oxidoreductase [Fimbriimonadaceae bacterium]|nr:FAD-dependent oxidoreductase [Chitinophagales bacterium]
MNTYNADIIIVGAGMAGLMAGKILSENGLKVIIEEARDRIGGRVYTYEDDNFPEPVELGAEFIHGDLPVTFEILKEAKINYTATGGESYRFENGKLLANDFFILQWSLLEEKLSALNEDITIADFLNTHFAGEEFVELRNYIRGFVEGYDAADPKLASAFALRNEWLSKNDETSYRITGGYAKLIEYLYDNIIKHKGEIILSSPIKEVQWNDGYATVITDEQKKYSAKKIIIAVPIGVLQQSAITFYPEIPEKISAAKQIGYGDVIKILIAFKKRFWEDAGLRNLGFLFTGKSIPTWWTQHPQNSSVLTGWLAGPPAGEMKNINEDAILQNAITSLAETFQFTTAELEGLIIAKKVVNWSADKFTGGAYAYATLYTAEARKILSEPVDDIIYFAGEALFDGPAMGTVEAALSSGKEVAEKIIKMKGR